MYFQLILHYFMQYLQGYSNCKIVILGECLYDSPDCDLLQFVVNYYSCQTAPVLISASAEFQTPAITDSLMIVTNICHRIHLIIYICILSIKVIEYISLNMYSITKSHHKNQ